MSEGIFVHRVLLGPWDNFIYFIGDRPSRKVAVVDPAWHAPTIRAELERLDVELAAILCTHSHFDHVNAVEALLETHDVPVHMLEPEVAFSGFACENLRVSKPGDQVRIGEHLELTMMHTPGHTPGSCSYRLRDGVVTGDTLFVNGCGRCDFVGGDPETMFATLKALIDKLPAETTMYPGHDYGPTPSATLDAQLRDNPYLRHATVGEFVAHRMDGKTPNTSLPPAPSDWQPDAGA
ncbi:putative polyketide biosynthesis zinc-dependent hydrolase BaeB [Enhygromyxa salina]|uniref:Putative polyketide biosynthesis zinc-dependent hydrolase BaeB n=1 Tax=Enhygromyxa salina TaxID=215803 RepID=A0A2S9XRC4_9BACT|nr:MBL fold metallo-hydrolase [Enhygromyxa salina]PRP95417.1 putative polyketide biosynthesis zinc-dependent hydrolase BaeB [Enhygromyxa salina]